MGRSEAIVLGGVILALIVFVAIAYGEVDPWATFHAESVRDMSCTAESMLVATDRVDANGKEIMIQSYESIATARRDGMDDWEQTIASYPQTTKGRHQAIEACTRWIDQAHDRVMKAQKK